MIDLVRFNSKLEGRDKMSCFEIPSIILDSANRKVEHTFGLIPFKYRGITITHELIKAAIEILNSASDKALPQNSRNAVKDKTPDGLDKRIKEILKTNLRTANIVSDVLKTAGIVTIISVLNPTTKRNIKGTKLLLEWTW